MFFELSKEEKGEMFVENYCFDSCFLVDYNSCSAFFELQNLMLETRINQLHHQFQEKYT